MRHTPKLVLRKERLGELTDRQLSSVAGASGPICFLTEDLSCVRCPSVPFTNCTILQETRGCLDTVTCPTDVC